jgi:hypothetical protein
MKNAAFWVVTPCGSSKNRSSSEIIIFYVIPFYFQSVPVDAANSAKLIPWQVEDCAVALFCN